MEIYFVKYRKIVLIASVYMFLYFFYEMYKGVAGINSGSKGEGTGTIINSCISLFVAIYFLVMVRKANKKIKEESTVAGDSNNAAGV